jgi:hypothetical protein
MKYCEIHYRGICQNGEGVLIRNLMHTYPLEGTVTEDAEKARQCHHPPNL